VIEPSFEDWLREERARLVELAVEALGKLLRHHVRASAVEPAIQVGLKLLGLDPTQESVYRTLMWLYEQQDRRGAALRLYETCLGVLERELGDEPEPETRDLWWRARFSPSGA